MTPTPTDAPLTGQIVDAEDLRELMNFRRMIGERIVFTNGCFDILHAGHVRYLQQARELGDLLVVGLNSDRSVRGLKGHTRPIIGQEDRAELLAALRCVDYVCIFDELRPDDLLEKVRPHIHVKGGDYRPQDLPEAEVVMRHGGQVVIMPLLEGRSTTGVVETILAGKT